MKKDARPWAASSLRCSMFGVRCSVFGVRCSIFTAPKTEVLPIEFRKKINPMNYTKRLTAALFMGSLFQASAMEPGKSQTLTSPEQVPEGLSAADWSSIRSAYSSSRITNAASITSQQAYLKASNTGASDLFGTSVAVAGDTVVVGAPGEDSSTTGVNSVPNESGGDSGAAYVFIRSGGIWSQQAYLKASNTSAGDLFGISVAVAGDTVVVGARGESSSTTGVNSVPNEAASQSGAVYVFMRSGSSWSQQAYLKASNTGAFDQFGYSVAVAGDTVVVGANLEDSSTPGVNSVSNEAASASGAAYVFVRSGSTWNQQAYLKASNTGANDNFGTSVAVAGDTVVVGAKLEGSSTTGVNGVPNEAAGFSGAAYVFIRSGSTWSQQAYLKASNTGVFDNFAYSVAVAGDTVVVGALGEGSLTTGVNSLPNELASGSGAAYVFIRSGSTWSQQAYLKASNTSANDYFGTSVAVAGDTIVVGAKSESSSTTGVNSMPNQAAIDSGAAYVFVRGDGNWSQQAYLKASNTGASDFFGNSVAVSGSTVISGSHQEDSITTGVSSVSDEAARQSGAAFVFIRSDGNWSQQGYLKASNTGASDFFGNSVAVSGSTVISGSHQEDSITTGVNSVPDEAARGAGAAYIFTLPVAEPPPIIPPTVVKFMVKVKVSNTKFGKVTGSGSFNTGSKVVLKATAKKGHRFLGWYEKKKLVSKNRLLVLKKLTANRSLAAKFK